MALPTTIVANAATPGYSPPFKSSGGAFYVIAVSGAVTDCFKATDPTDSWSVVDPDDNPITGEQTLAAVQSGDLIHIVHQTSATKVLNYSQFSMATDQWVVADEAIETMGDAPTFRWASIAVRSDGTVVVVYAGDTDQVMGGKKERVDVNIRSTVPAWSGPTALDAAGDVHYGNPNCVLGTNDFVHCVWQMTANTADPPAFWTDTEGRSIDPADDSLSTVDLSDAHTQDLLAYSNLSTYDDSGTQRIIMVGPNWAEDVWYTLQGIEDVNDDLELTATALTESFLDAVHAYGNGEVGVHTQAVLSTDIHVLYGGGAFGGADQDLYYTTSTDDGASWSTPTEEIDAITVNFISANIYVRGSDTVMAYVYDDGGVQKYNEKILISGGAVDLVPPPLLHSFARARSANY